jgi:hypothetical protein
MWIGLMTHFLATDDKPEGFMLEHILTAIRQDIIKRADKISEDNKPEAKQVLKNNIRILGMITDCIELAENSTQVLDKSFGRSNPNKPRIGTP